MGQNIRNPGKSSEKVVSIALFGKFWGNFGIAPSEWKCHREKSHYESLNNWKHRPAVPKPHSDRSVWRWSSWERFDTCPWSLEEVHKHRLLPACCPEIAEGWGLLEQPVLEVLKDRGGVCAREGDAGSISLSHQFYGTITEFRREPQKFNSAQLDTQMGFPTRKRISLCVHLTKLKRAMSASPRMS